MALDAAARTHPGKVRDVNEDAFVCRPKAGLFAVVDGMGGEAHGDVAAAIAVRALAEVPSLPGIAGETALAQAMRAARDRVLAEADADRTKEGMGAVATAIRFDDDGRTLRLAHVGDTRAYLVHAAGVRLLTHDHVAEGPAGTKRQVARDIGRRDLVGDWVETGHAAVQPGDLVVLCSDGLTDAVAQNELIGELVQLRGAPSADAVASRLVGLALAHGGPDNVTVVAIRVGRFSRREASRPLVWAVVSALAVAAGLAGAWYVTGGEWPGAERGYGGAVPRRVEGVVVLGSRSPLVLGAASQTVVFSESALAVSGQRLEGSDWTVTVRPQAALTLERLVVALERDLVVYLEPGAQVIVRDVRVERGRLRLRVPQQARATLDHVFLPSDEALVVEGGGVVLETDVRRLATPPLGDAP